MAIADSLASGIGAFYMGVGVTLIAVGAVLRDWPRWRP